VTGNLFGAVHDEQRSAAILVAELDVHHAIRVLVGIRIEEHAIDDAEDSRGCPDSQHQGKHGAGGKTGRFRELPKREA
jgi:hypothetical protein